MLFVIHICILFTQDPCEGGAYGVYGQFDSYINPNDFTSKVTPAWGASYFMFMSQIIMYCIYSHFPHSHTVLCTLWLLLSKDLSGILAKTLEMENLA